MGTSVFCFALSGFRASPPARNVTYADDVAPLINRSCIECHRPGGVAPFSLIGYGNVKKWIPTIATVTKTRFMPPWRAAEGYGEFADKNRLSDAEVAMLQKWFELGAPLGDARRVPAAPTFSSLWPLRQPDAIFKPSKAYKLAAEGEDYYRNFVFKNTFKHSVWLKAMAIKPGNPKVVHHVIVYFDASGGAEEFQKENTDGQEGYTRRGGPGFIPSGTLGAWTPGTTTRECARGSAFLLKPNYSIVMQVHYHLVGKPQEDQTQLGLYLAREPIQKEMMLDWILNLDIKIPAGDANHIETQEEPVDDPMTIYTVTPHMHLLGRSMKAEVQFPNGQLKPLIYIPNWDFDWQNTYVLKQPMHVPKGSVIKVQAVYDNSSGNPRNPNNPPKFVKFGEDSDEEMFLLIVGYTLDHPATD